MKNCLPALLFIFLFSNILTAQFADSLLLIRQDTVYFDSGKADLRDAARALLDSLPTQVTADNKLQIHIEAHTDAVGSSERNAILSAERARSVRDYLSPLFDPAPAIFTEPYGESAPQADNDSEEGRQRNRRAVIAVYQKRLMTTLSGQVTDGETGEGIEATVIIRSKNYRDSFLTELDGHYERPVPANIVIGVDVFKKGYFYDTQMLKTLPGNIPKLESKLPPAVAGAVVDIKNFYFVGGRPILLPRSFPQLDKLLKFMQLNDTIRIEIAGHINRPNLDPETITSREMMLSWNRALVVYDHLKKHNISTKRMKYQGYGSSEMRFPKARSAREQQLNRRVEIRILGSEEIISEAEPE